MKQQIFKKLKDLKKEYQEAVLELQDPEVISNITNLTSLNKTIKKIKSKVVLFDRFIFLEKEIIDAKKMMKDELDAGMISILKETLSTSRKELIDIEEQLIEIMIEKDPNNEKDIIMEIKGAAGGDEAKIFAGDLYRMYLKYASKMGYNIEVLDQEESDAGGFSYISLSIKGEDVYEHLKFESGVHRVQRIPITETQGRVHTSTATVSVMPEAEEIDVEINQGDIKVDTYRAGGAGGQHVNKTDSAVRVTHTPTGIVAQSQDGKSQHQNKDKAMTMLRTRIYEAQLQKEISKHTDAKRILIGSGDRSEKIRTYNFPQNRVTDHRINLTLKKLDRVTDGGLEEIIDVLLVAQKEGILYEK